MYRTVIRGKNMCELIVNTSCTYREPTVMTTTIAAATITPMLSTCYVRNNSAIATVTTYDFIANYYML